MPPLLLHLVYSTLSAEAKFVKESIVFSFINIKIESRRAFNSVDANVYLVMMVMMINVDIGEISVCVCVICRVGSPE